MYVEAIASGGGSDWFYIAVIHAPNGADVHVDDGDEDIDATVASGDYIGIPVHNQNSTYTITVTMNGLAAPDQTFTTGSTSGQMIEKTFEFAEIDITYDDEFRGQTATMTDGTHTATVTIPSSGNNLVLRVPYTGNWHISAVDPVSGDTFYTSPDPIAITSLSQTVSCHLFVIPDGKTVTPTDDIQTWLACGNIKGKSYTTLAEVLADEDTLRKLLTDDNAIDYLKRSTTWASVYKELVPEMTSNTTPSGEAFASSEFSSYKAYQAFNRASSVWNSNTNETEAYVGYDFGVGKAFIADSFSYDHINDGAYATDPVSFKIQASNVGGSNPSDWTDVSNVYGGQAVNTGTGIINTNGNAYRYYRLIQTSGNQGLQVKELQFYSPTGIPDSELAMSYIGAYDYAAETLLGDGTWNTAIYESEYADYVLNASVPKMTSDSAPSGQVTYSGQFSDYNGYKAFNEDESHGWLENSSNPYMVVGSWIAYEFTSPVKIKDCKWGLKYEGNPTSVSGRIEAFDGTNWVPVSTATSHTSETTNNYPVDIVDTSGVAYTKYRWACTVVPDSNNNYGLKVQFYGREAAGVQTWLKAAGLDRPYTTLAEVLADHNALAALMSSHDAVDYLVTVKSWIDAITADETAMRYIGRRNYAADTLLADSDWAAAIGSSAYSSYVFNMSIPKMTDDTHPSGEASATNPSGSYPAYYAFDQNDSTFYCAATVASGTSFPIHVTYEFTSAKKAIGYKLKTSSMVSTMNYKIQGSNDGFVSDTHDLTSAKSVGSYGDVDEALESTGTYKYYRLLIISEVMGSSSFNVGGVVEFDVYGRSDVDETTIDIFSAASDTVYYLDPTLGTQIPVATTDTTGKATIQKSNLPDGEYTLYSTAAKDPNNLSNSYHKRVSVDSDTMDVMVMPDDALYWYGWSGNFEIGTDANGWTNLSGDDPATYINMNTRDISYTWSTGTSCGGLGTKNKISDAEKLRSIVKDGSGAGDRSMYLMVNTAKSLVGSLGAQFKRFNNLASSDAVISYDLPDGYKSDIYLGCGKAASGYSLTGVLTKALWFVRHNPLANFFSAANDTVYYMSGGVQVVFAETNELGEAVVDYSKLTPGSYTLISSVAKDPDNLSNPYSKIVTVDGNPIYFMPDNALYWWGWKSDNLEIISTANGWSHTNGFRDPVFNANYVECSSSGSSVTCGISSSYIVAQTTIHSITDGVTSAGASVTYGLIGESTSKAIDLNTPTSLMNGTLAKNNHTMTNNGYVWVGSVNTRVTDVYALWYE